jgi:hypothetical protein
VSRHEEREELALDPLGADALVFPEIGHELSNVLESVGPGSTAFTVTRVPDVSSASPRATAS